MSGKRRKYTLEFREQAARLVIERAGRWHVWLLRSVSVNKCWVAGCAWRRNRPRLAILARCWMLMSAQSWNVCAEKRRITFGPCGFEKSRGLLRLRTEPVEAYRVIEAEKATYASTNVRSAGGVTVGVLQMAQDSRRRPVRPSGVEPDVDAEVAFHEASDGVYGAPRILANLREDGETVSRRRWRRRCAGRAWPGSARADRHHGGRPRCASSRTWWGAGSTPAAG